MIFSYISDLLAAVSELYRKIMLTLKYKTLMCSHAELPFGHVILFLLNDSCAKNSVAALRHDDT